VALEMSTTMVLMSTPAGSGRKTSWNDWRGMGLGPPPATIPVTLIQDEPAFSNHGRDIDSAIAKRLHDWPWSLCNGPACQQRCVPVSRLQDPGDGSDHGGYLDRWALSRLARRAVHLPTTPAPVQTHRSPPRLGRGLEQASGAPAPVRNCPSVQFLTSTIRNDLENQPMRHDTCNCRNSMSTRSKHLWIELHLEKATDLK